MKFSSKLVQCELDTPLGAMVLAASATGLAGAWFVGQRHVPSTQAWTHSLEHPVLQHAGRELRPEAAQPGDILVFHSNWNDLAQANANKEFVVITDYPKQEQRPHKLRVAVWWTRPPASSTGCLP